MVARAIAAPAGKDRGVVIGVHPSLYSARGHPGVTHTSQKMCQSTGQTS